MVVDPTTSDRIFQLQEINYMSYLCKVSLVDREGRGGGEEGGGNKELHVDYFIQRFRENERDIFGSSS
jgi:hypothetical protein